MPKTVIVSGGFDPLHSGHIAYLKSAKALGYRLVVGVNSDAWLIVKKGRFFMPLKERMAIMQELSCVDLVVSFDDSDGSACSLIESIRRLYPEDELVFANGGDRHSHNIPEMSVEDVEFVFGVGGTDKKNSSSWILENWSKPHTEKTWGYYTVLHEAPEIKVKELVVEPNMSLSLQRHSYRAEHWHVAEGQALARVGNSTHFLGEHAAVEIPQGTWHQLSNPSDRPLRIIEIQYGERCEEDDIERVLTNAWQDATPNEVKASD
jgi:cytidyltransferase-like protein